MIDHIQLLRNIGQFDSVTGGSQLAFSKITLFYAGNSRGKTTLAAIFRSLASGDAKLITERRRLSATQTPHVVLNAGIPYIFQNGQWSSLYPDLVVFDDAFVAENVCSGVEIGADHRQNLHELILGAQGVTLNATLQGHVAKIEQHNKTLKTKADAIPSTQLGSLTVDTFCALKAKADVTALIQQAERSLAAARSAETVSQQSGFSQLALPAFDRLAIEALLARDLPALDAAAAMRVQAHLSTLGGGGEAWVGQGMGLVPSASEGTDHEVCPFCAQDLDGSSVMEAYRSYFSESYSDLKASIDRGIAGLARSHGNDAPAAFERAVRVAIQRRDFWKDFVEVPELNIDTAAIARTWNKAREMVLTALNAKKAAPLDAVTLTSADLLALDEYESATSGIVTISDALLAVNPKIALVKEQAASANVTTLAADLAKLKATEARHSSATNLLCQAYMDEKAAKKITEGLRDTARGALDVYRTAIFPAYETAINAYLIKFNAGFRLGSVTSVNNRSGSSCSYNVLINNVAVAITGNDGDPCFKNTLSAGDRNTLALAFFFASLDQDPKLSQKVVVIDDPMTSLDEHRSLTTVQETGRLLNRVQQVVVLSHSKSFLCAIWQEADKTSRAALKIIRSGTGSVLDAWDVNQDSITEHDKRHAAVTAYIRSQQGTNERAVAAALRPILECYTRVAYPAVFQPGSLLGPFINICNQRKGTPTEILSESNIIELRDLLDYGNKFHHDTNAAWETEQINDQELLNFCGRTLKFTSRS